MLHHRPPRWLHMRNEYVKKKKKATHASRVYTANGVREVDITYLLLTIAGDDAGLPLLARGFSVHIPI